MDYLKIDGNLGEGGGSILRLAAGFSVLMSTPLRIKNIRGTRNPPGLRLQHLIGLQTLRDITDGRLSECDVGTTQLEMVPGTDFKTNIVVRIRTAGSIALLCQTIQNAFIRYPTGVKRDSLKVTIQGGGTFGLGAPDPYYLNDITYYYFDKMRYKCQISDIKDGFYPKGGAGAELTINPLEKPTNQLSPLGFRELGCIKKIGGTIVVSENLRKPRVAERIYDSLVDNLTQQPIKIPDHIQNKSISERFGEDIFQVDQMYVKSRNPGVGLNVWAEYSSGVRVSSGTVLGKRGIPSEVVGKNAAKSLLKQLRAGATVDEHLADQIIPLLYLCEKPCKIIVPEITSHMQTNVDILNRFRRREYHIEKLEDAFSFNYL